MGLEKRKRSRKGESSLILIEERILIVIRSSEAMMEVCFRFLGARRIAIFCFLAERITAISVGIPRQENRGENFRLLLIGLSKLDGTRIIRVSWLQLLLMVELLYNQFRTPNPSLIEPLAGSSRPWMMMISLTRLRRNLKVQGLR